MACRWRWLCISFSWNSYGTLAADGESLVELEFIDLGKHTELRIRHTKLTTGEAEDMDIGWVSALQSLDQCLREQRLNESAGDA